MEPLIELTEADLDQIVGGTGVAFASISQLAIGGHTNIVAALVLQAASPAAAAQLVVAQSASA
jgi:hypothetical protein